jgi:hypothetical protein
VPNINNFLSGSFSEGRTNGNGKYTHVEGGGLVKIDVAATEQTDLGGIAMVKEFDNVPFNDEVAPFILTGAKNFGKYPTSANAFGVQGWVVVYIQNKVEYRSDLGAADQTGSNLTITQVEDNTTDLSFLKTVTATFNCKLYGPNGAVKTLTNGKLRTKFLVN